MQRSIFLILFASLVFSLGACEEQATKENTISESNLTDREMGILSATTDKSFVFDFDTDSSYKELSIWIEKYEQGKLVEGQLGYINSDISDSGQVLFSIVDSNHSENQSMLTLSILDEGGSGKVTFTENIPENHSSIWSSNQAESIPVIDEIILASLIYSNQSHMSSLSDDFYSDMENHLEEIEDYDTVYLLKGEFIE